MVLKTKTPSDARRLTLDKLKESGITEKHVAQLGIKPFTAAQAASLNLFAAKAGFKIPYYGIDGKPTGFFRYRFLESVKEGFSALTDGKEPKYAQPENTVNELYFPRTRVNWSVVAKDPEQRLIITEGEIKAACACLHDFPTIGLGGVWCFRSGKHRMAALPQFKEIEWQGREVYIVFDSDAAINPNVVAAESALCGALCSMGARPFICRLPALNSDGKTGLDDYLVAEGAKSLGFIFAQADDYMKASELHDLNNEVIYVEDPGFVLRLDTGQRMRPRDFYEHAYATRTFIEEKEDKDGNVKRTEKSAAKEWIKWPLRATVRKVTYAPGKDRFTDIGEYNSWKGWKVKPKRGDISRWRTLLDFLFREADKSHLRWFEQWLAYPIQFPGTKLYTSILFWGIAQGTGKSAIGYSMFEIYGRNSTEIRDRDLQSNYNDWAVDKQFIMGDEIVGGDKRSVADHMKGLITQKEMRINAKYIPSYTVPDAVNWYFTSNHPDSFFMEDDDRRNFIHEVVGKPMETAFYKEYEKWMFKGGGGPEALFYHLLNVDLDGFDPTGHAPVTDSKLDMIELGRSDLGSWIATMKHDPDAVLRLNGTPIKHALWTAEELRVLYDPMNSKRLTANGVSRELRRAGFRQAWKGQPILTSHGQQRLWMIRSPEQFERKKRKDIGDFYDKERSTGTTNRSGKITVKKRNR